MRLRPRVELAGVEAAVIDISEGGIRILNDKGLPVSLGELLSAALRMHSGESAHLSGCVIRITRDEVALSFSRGPSFGSILREQRAVRARQPYWT
jgi:hypothetical protein